MYYAQINSQNKLVNIDVSTILADEYGSSNVQNIEVTEELYTSYQADNLRYIWNGSKIVVNPDYEQDKQAKERAELDQMTLTPADVERALYKAKGMDFDDLKTLITQQIPNIDIKGLSIEFRAKDFYRGAMASGLRLFDVVGALLGYTPVDMDYLFKYKELPNNDN
jgi:wobble nucleotide-excising tRNase